MHPGDEDRAAGFATIFKRYDMEQLNRVELRGMVGTANVQDISGRKVCRFSVATSRAYRDPMGVAKIDTTWHRVNAWDGKGMPDLDMVRKGCKIEVVGRIRNNKFMGSDGLEHVSSEVQAIRMRLIEGEDSLANEM